MVGRLQYLELPRIDVMLEHFNDKTLTRVVKLRVSTLKKLRTR